MAELNELKRYLKDEVERSTTKSKGKMYHCPLCGSGTGANKTGALSIDSKKNNEAWRCFSCGQGGDIFDFYAALHQVSASEAARALLARYGSPEQPAPYAVHIGSSAEAEPPAGAHDYSQDIERFAAALAGSPGEAYLTGRGLTLETIKDCQFGYDAAHGTVTMPYNREGTYYGQRAVDDTATRKHYNLTGVDIPLYNPAALYSGQVCFIVESPICAASIKQAGGQAVAISGTSGANRLYTQLAKKPTQAALILALDNDEAGRKAAAEIGARLEADGIFVVNGTAAIMGDEKDKASAGYRNDINEVLQKDGTEALKAAIDDATRATLEARSAQDAERQERTGANMIDTFLEAVQTRRYEPMPTGISDIDRAIGGGFIRQQIVLLGAAPGVGKTALAQWIFEGMAKAGTSCIFLNLEMAQEQILARSISRIAARQGATLKTTDILQGYKWTAEQRQQVTAAAEVYRKEIAPRMIYNPQGIGSNLDAILAYISKEAQRAEAAGEAAPICVLDYLQLVTGKEREDATAAIKRAVFDLKAYAVKHNTLVFIIIAHNRESNKSGTVTMDAGRDTSALEYSADLQLALSFTLCKDEDGKKAKSPSQLTDDEKRFVTLTVTKGRFGGGGKTVDLYFNGETMTYTQTAPKLQGARARL